MIVCDTREKKNHHVLNYFKEHDIDYVRVKVDTGDYMDSNNMSISIDRKQNLEELSGNMCSPDSSRFWREVRRSKDEGIKLIVLIEDGKIACINEVKKWRSKYTKVTGKWLYSEMVRCHIAYGVEFLFCDKEETGAKIIELLGGVA